MYQKECYEQKKLSLYMFVSAIKCCTRMLTLESRRFPVLGEVSFLSGLRLMAKETEQGVTITWSRLGLIYYQAFTFTS